MNRNRPCPCGSGRKFKHCCERRQRRGGGAAGLLDRAQSLQNSGRHADAAELFQQLLATDPGHHAALYGLAVCRMQAGDTDQAVALMQQAVAAAPAAAAYRQGLGLLYMMRGEFQAAATSLRQLVELEPAAPHGWFNLALCLQNLDQPEQAVQAYEQGLTLAPGDLDARMKCGSLLYRRGRLIEAAPHFEAVVAAKPDHVQSRRYLGTIRRRLGELSAALEQFQRAHKLEPDNPSIIASLAGIQRDRGDAAAAMALYRRSLDLQPGDRATRSNWLMAMNYLDDIDEAELARAHRSPGAQLDGQQGEARAPEPGGKLRVGLVSGDLRQHSVAYFIEPLLRHLDPGEIDVHVYYNHGFEDQVSQRLKAHCAHWRVIHALPDPAAAEQIRADRIDVLVDLSGHSGGNRLALFAMKPAPVQVTWLGYPNTTGLDAMDYRLTDHLTDPPGDHDDRYSEQLLRLDGHFCCYQPPPEAPPVAPAPALENGYITFGSFNNLAKLSPSVLDCWSGILKAVPGSRLLLKTRALSDPATLSMLHLRFTGRGVDPGRLTLLGRDAGKSDHLQRYAEIDIALDPFPYNGTTTSCEALWCGVPVIALEGDTHRSRVTASFLRGLGLEALVAEDATDYQLIAADFAGDPPRLDALRQEIRPGMEGSLLMDGAAFARRFHQAMAEIAGHQRVSVK